MDAYSLEGWHDFLVAAAGASGALAGLVFIGISINVTRIVALPGLPGRAAQTITILANALAVTLLLLGPMESTAAIGLVTLLVGLAGWAVVMLFQRGSHTHAEEVRRHRTSTIVICQAATLPFIVGGISVLTEAGGGLYWMQAGVVLSMLAALVNGWVLLVEILR
jgi:modulator of FtsH protease